MLEIMEAGRVSPTVLTIAGFDPSSGAGVTADLAVFSAHGCFGTAAVTALTVQSTTGVRRVQPVEASVLVDTLQCLDEDLAPDGIKIGMLADRPQVAAVVAYLDELEAKQRRPYVVLDPVLQSSSGKALLTAEGFDLLRSGLLPLVDVITPNTQELSLLTGLPCISEGEIEEAMAEIAALYTGLPVLATGGHRATPDDVLLQEGVYTTLRGSWVQTSSTHGTGCALSSALLCSRLQGLPLPQAAAAAKEYVANAMRYATPRGSGHGPMNLLWPFSEQAMH